MIPGRVTAGVGTTTCRPTPGPAMTQEAGRARQSVDGNLRLRREHRENALVVLHAVSRRPDDRCVHPKGPAATGGKPAREYTVNLQGYHALRSDGAPCGCWTPECRDGVGSVDTARQREQARQREAEERKRSQPSPPPYNCPRVEKLYEEAYRAWSECENRTPHECRAVGERYSAANRERLECCRRVGNPGCAASGRR